MYQRDLTSDYFDLSKVYNLHVILALTAKQLHCTRKNMWTSSEHPSLSLKNTGYFAWADGTTLLNNDKLKNKIWGSKMAHVYAIAEVGSGLSGQYFYQNDFLQNDSSFVLLLSWLLF